MNTSSSTLRTRSRSYQPNDFWTQLRNGLLNQAGLIVAVVTAIVGSIWVLSSEFQKIHVSLATLQGEMRGGFAKVDERFVGVNDRFSEMDKRMDRLELRTERIEGVVNDLRVTVGKIDTRLGAVENHLGRPASATRQR